MKGENEPAVIDKLNGGESALDCDPVSERIPGAFTLIPDGVSCDFRGESVGGSRCDWDKGVFCGKLESKARHGASVYRGSVLGKFCLMSSSQWRTQCATCTKVFLCVQVDQCLVTRTLSRVLAKS